MSNLRVTCIIPAFNEAATIFTLIKKIQASQIFDEVIVVDDGSKDKTYALAKKAGAAVLRHAKNKGKGAAIKKGLRTATGKIIVFLDGDILRLDLEQIKVMIRQIRTNKADVVIGTFKFSCFQTFTEVVYKPLMLLLFPEVLETVSKGCLSGQRAFKINVLDKIKLCSGFGFETAANIELTFMKPAPKIRFVDLGNISVKQKGYQKSMDGIVHTIVDYAKKYRRLKRLKESSFGKVAHVLCRSIK